MTVLVCEPVIHAVAYCENKAFFKQASEALIQGLLPGADEEAEENEGEEELEGSEEEEEEDLENEESEDNEEDESKEDEEMESNNDSISGEEAEFDSEEFDNIKDDCHDSDFCENDQEVIEEESLIFDYSLLSKFIFDFGAREDVLVRNRRFLYELSQIIEEVASGTLETCCDEGDSCCGKSESCCN